MIENGRAYFLFDGDCGICTRASDLTKQIDARHLFVVEPYQSFTEAELLKFGITYDQCNQKIQIISQSGKVYCGAFGLNYFLWQYWLFRPFIAVIYALPILLLLELFGYWLIARNRHHLSRWFGYKACLLKH